MEPGVYNFTIPQGATFSRVITWRDSANALINLSGYTARMKAKNGAGTLLNLTNGSGLTLGGALGTITIELSAAETAALNFENARYDLELVNGANVTRLLEGTIKLSRETTA